MAILFKYDVRFTFSAFSFSGSTIATTSTPGIFSSRLAWSQGPYVVPKLTNPAPRNAILMLILSLASCRSNSAYFTEKRSKSKFSCYISVPLFVSEIKLKCIIDTPQEVEKILTCHVIMKFVSHYSFFLDNFLWNILTNIISTKVPNLKDATYFKSLIKYHQFLINTNSD